MQNSRNIYRYTDYIQQHASLNIVIFLCIEMLEETVAAEKDQVVDENVVDTEQPIGL